MSALQYLMTAHLLRQCQVAAVGGGGRAGDSGVESGRQGAVFFSVALFC